MQGRVRIALADRRTGQREILLALQVCAVDPLRILLQRVWFERGLDRP